MERKVIFKSAEGCKINIVCNGVTVGTITNCPPFNSACYYDSTGRQECGYFDVAVSKIKREFKALYMDMPCSMFNKALALAKM